MKKTNISGKMDDYMGSGIIFFLKKIKNKK